jgi:acyl dehydratase
MHHFEDLPVGYTWRVGSHVMQLDEMVELATRWDPQPFHIDEAAARASPFGGIVASSLHLFAICTRLFFDQPDRIATVAMLGKDRLRLPNPARPGDTLVYDTICIACREPSRRTDVGIVTLADVLANQRGEPVLTQEVTLMVARRPAV